MTVVSRGARGHGSVVELNRPPKADDFLTGSHTKTRLTGTGRASKLEEIGKRIDLIENRLGGLDIVEVLANFEKRLQKIEGRYAKTTHEGTSTDTNTNTEGES